MPASYPGSVKSFTTKVDGETIEEDHVNDLQLEVAAIETDLLAGLRRAITPIGAILIYGGASAPSSDWLICDGSSVLRASYPALFTAIGTAYGAADGTHFNVPELRQRFPLGLWAEGAGTGQALGEAGGDIDHTHTLATVPSHTHTATFTGASHGHTLTDPGHTHPITHINSTYSGGSNNICATSNGANNVSEATDSATTGASIVAATAGGTISVDPSGSASPATSAANPPYLTVNYIIRAL
jgi:microcystin-dependent protein